MIPSPDAIEHRTDRESAKSWLAETLALATLGAGDPGLGKSFLTMDLAARVTTGATWPDSPTVAAPRGSVVLLSAEDDLADTIRPRLDAAGADCARVVALRAVQLADDSDRGVLFID